MYNKSKVVSFMVALAMTIPCANGLIFNTSYDVDATNDIMSVDEITKNMGLGWNLGNSLESNGITTDVYFSTVDISIDDYEQFWGNPKVTEDLITAVKNKGFNTIRIPVTWYEHITYDNGNYTIDSAWMDRVQEVVNYAYNQGMYVILNVHHEDWINRSDFTSSYDAMSTELKQVWFQIATHFANYDQHLIFEGMNEPRAVGSSDIPEWTGNSACYDIINKLNNDFVTTVRSVSSTYQSTRLLMIPSYAASSYSSVYSSLTIPKVANSIDSDNDGDDDYVAVSLHAYSPYDFAMGDSTSNYTYDHSTFSDTYKSELDNIFNDIRTTFTNNDIPVVIGEFSASDYNNTEARQDWATYYMTIAKEMGIPCVLWDNNISLANSNMDENFNYSEVHGYINRDDSNLSWYSNGELVVNSLLSIINDSSVVWDSKSTYPMNAHADYNSGISVTITQNNGEFFMSDALNSLNENTEIAIQYTDTIPNIALMNSSWNGFTKVSPYDFDTTNKIAYFSYESIQKAWDSTTFGNIAYIKIIDSNYNNLSVSSVKVLSTENVGNTTDVIETYSLSLSGNIGVNVYATLTDETIFNNEAYVEFTNSQNEVVSQIPITDDLKQSDGRYKFTLEVNATQMSDEFKVQVVSGEKSSDTMTVSVRKYCEYVINNSTDTNLVNLVKSMLNYGAYTQLQFGSTSTLANININDNDKSLPNDSEIDLSAYSTNLTYQNTDSGIKLDSASLLLGSETSIRCYLSLDESKNIDDFRFTVDGKTVIPKLKDGRYYIEVPNISATDLDNMYTIQVKTSSDESVLTLNYGAFSYVSSVLSSSSNDNLKNVVKALYVYNQEAEVYFN